MDEQGVSLSAPTTPAVWACMVCPFHHQQHGHAGCIYFHSQQYGGAMRIPFHQCQYGCAGCVPFHSQQNTNKKENKISCKEIQNGAVTKSYSRNGFLIYEEMRKYITIFEEAVSHTLLCNCSISISLHMRKICFSFLSVNGNAGYNHFHSQEYGHVVCRVYAFHRQQYGSAGCIPFHHQQYEHAGCVPFHCQKYEQTVCVPFNLQQYEHTGCTTIVNARMSDCPASGQSGTRMNKNADAETSLVPK
jgi:hypothetical protein